MVARQTKQRQVILQVIAESEHPLSVEDILAQGVSQLPSLGIATVYREIKRLQETGEVHAVSLPGGQVRYERHGKHHHHHFQCNRCGSVFDISGCTGNLEQLLPPGFHLSGHEIFLYGLCPDCASQ